jgi:hypothetical protein
MTVYTARSQVPQGTLLAPSALSGGDFRDYLREALTVSQGRLCLCLAPAAMDFPLPCPSGQGTPLDHTALKARYDGSPCHYSQGLCWEYFSYLGPDGAHVVCYDSLRSLGEKWALADALGVPMVLVEDRALLGQLRGEKHLAEREVPKRI